LRVQKHAPRPFEELTGVAAADHERWLAHWREAGDPERRREVDETSAILLEITRRLDAAHLTPDLGNKPDPVDELVYIILSRRTREGAYQAAYCALKSSFSRWELVTEASVDDIEVIISFSGLGRRKAVSLKAALSALIEAFGSCTLEPTTTWTDAEVSEFLGGLPEVGPKSAACVMMCSLDRPAFPVDAHVGRVLERLAVMEGLGIDLRGRDHKFKQAALWNAVPPSLRYALHVNMLVHGRVACLPHRPRCGGCVLVDLCPSHDSSDCAPRG
jgi:endonuclease III